MNKRQHIVQQQFLKNEAAVFKRLKTVYNQSSKDINVKIKELDIDIAGLKSVWDNFEGSEDEKAELLSRIQSKIYQKQYQQAIQGQVDGILKDLQNNTYKSISEYLEKSYEDGFIGTMYSLQGQGIPLIMPLDQEAMVRAVQLDSKISKGLYNHLGENVGMLKKHITAQVSRGIANGYSYEQVAQQLALKMKGTYNNAGGALAYAMRIARTEGHRIQIQGAMDACYKARDMGADVVKQWDSTLDDSTRESHIAVDGEIRELDEEFSNGLMFPGDPSGKAAEVINCRCALLERARWALDESELETLKKRAEFFGVDKTDSFEEYKKKYLKAVDETSKIEEITDALDFGYGDLTDDDYIKWMNDYDAHNSGVRLNADELKVIEDYTEGGFIIFNDVCRYSDNELLKKGYTVEEIANARKRISMLDGALSKYDLDTDIVTHRFERNVSWLTGKGNDVADLEALIGKEYTAKGFTSSGMLPNRFRFGGGKSDAVHFEIVTPKGTNGAFLSMSKKGENEFLYNRNTRFKILDGGERVVKELKYNFKTGMFDEIDVTERFLKVQVIPDNLTKTVNKVIMTPKISQDANYNYILSAAQKRNVDYNPVYNHTKQLTDDEIISAISGGDMTQGSCASVGLAYIGQKQGWEVLDFRDGHSRRVFGLTINLDKLSRMNGVKTIKAQGACSMTVGNRLVKQCEADKEYYLAVGRHASIIRKTTDGKLQYLELQSKNKSGWTDFDGNPRYTLHTRFGCSNTKSNSELYDFMIDLEESDFTSNDDFRTLLGYLNTSENEQRKGSSGTIK